MEKNSKCQMCGTAEWEWDPKQGGSRFAYEPVPKVCQGCYNKEALTEGSDRQLGMRVELQPTGTIESAKRLESAKNRQRSGRADRADRKSRRPARDSSGELSLR